MTESPKSEGADAARTDSGAGPDSAGPSSAALESAALDGGAPDGNGPREGERIAKLLARAGVASRREVERMIAEGRVQLHGQPVTTPATVLTSLHGLTVDGQPVRAAEATRLFAFHKPAGLLTAERDSTGRPTIYNALRNALPPGTPRLMPVGRLDLNTEGLLLLTNDGELKRALELPSTGIPRTYRARTYGDVTQAQLESLMDGIEIEGVRYGPIDANKERRTGANQWIEVTLTEGKNREVRRVLEHLGLEVSRLIRTAYGMFYIEDLPRGTAVEIAGAKVEQLRRDLKLASGRAAMRGGAARPPRIEGARIEGNRAERRQPLAGAAASKARSASPRVARKAAPSRPDESQGRRIKPTRPGRWDDERAASAGPAAEPGTARRRSPDAPRTGSRRPDGQRSENPRSDGRRSDTPRPDGGRGNARRERSSPARDELLSSRPRGGAPRPDNARGATPAAGAKPGTKPAAKPNNRPYAKPGTPVSSGRKPPHGGGRSGPRGGGKR